MVGREPSFQGEVMSAFDPDVFGPPKKQSAAFDADVFSAPVQAPAIVAPAQNKPSGAMADGRNAPGAIRGLASVMQGPTFGFSDEIIGAGQAAMDSLTGGLPFTEAYKQRRDYLRGAAQQEQENNPVFSAVTQGMASAPLALIGGPAQAAGWVGRMGGAAKIGGITGAIGGAGRAEDLDNIVGDVAMGGLTSAAMGGALSGVSDVARGVLGKGASVLGNAARRVRGVTPEQIAAERARAKVADAIAQDARGTVTQSGASSPGAQLEARLAKLGPDAPLATASGANSISLLDTLTTLPGRTKQAAKGVQRQVQVGIADRLRGAADEGLGTQGARLADTVDGLIQARATAAAPLYEQLRRVDFDPPTSMARTVAAADELGAIALARKIATAEERPFTLDVSAPSRWNAGDVDLVKRGLSAMIQKETRPDGTISEVGRSLTGLQRRLIDQLDDVTRGQDGRSLYESARRAFSEPSALKTAAELGSRALSRDEASLTAMTRNMDPGELEAFRVGAMEALRAKLGTQSGQTEYMNLWKNKTTQEKLKAIFGNERGYREFASALAKESQIKGIQRVGVGSPTAERLAGQESLDAIPDAVQAAASVKTGNLLGMVQPVVRTAQRWSTPQPVRDQMGRILLSTGPEAAANAAAMRSLIDSSNRSMLLNTELARQYGLLGGNLIGTRVQGGLLGQNAP